MSVFKIEKEYLFVDTPAECMRFHEASIRQLKSETFGFNCTKLLFVWPDREIFWQINESIKIKRAISFLFSKERKGIRWNFKLRCFKKNDGKSKLQCFRQSFPKPWYFRITVSFVPVPTYKCKSFEKPFFLKLWWKLKYEAFTKKSTKTLIF